MSIYSINRTGSMALAQVAANESYTSEDFGRIMYETQINDMAFFEAILACDFNEIKGLSEGTLLESEVVALNEKSLKDFVSGLCEDLKKFWGKIKGMLTDAINKIAAWSGKNGKRLVEQVRKTNFSRWNNTVPNVATYDYSNKKIGSLKGDIYTELYRAISDKNINTGAIAGEYLGRLVGAGHAISPSDYTKYCLEIAKRDPVELSKSNIQKFADEIDAARFHIDFIRGWQKRVEESIKNQMGNLKEAAKKEQNVAKLSGIVRAYQTVVATMCRTNIAITRADLKAKCKAVAAAIADNRNTVFEAAEMEVRCVMDEFDCMMTENLHMDYETRIAIADLVGAY